MSEHIVDAKRLLCPMPVIRTQNKAEELAKGDVLKVICTDPGATNDIPAWCRINGHKVLDIHTVDNEITIIIEVGGLG
ncbi:MAG: sulfurtransferase TusA family protein [Gammaproteobacteria bacterium]|jgi:tRNA 2-thiouridine synthesizing protein A